MSRTCIDGWYGQSSPYSFQRVEQFEPTFGIELDLAQILREKDPSCILCIPKEWNTQNLGDRNQDY
jgi:hypothetical protein